MENSFKKFKNRILLEVLIKCIIISFSLGLISFSAPLIYFKVLEKEFKILYLILIGLGVCVISFGLLFLILKPNKVKIAKRIDKELNLNEKVLTMVEYEKEEGTMIELQRSNTLSILSNTPIKNLTIKLGVILFILCGIAVASCTVALAIPYEKDITPVVDEPDYDLDSWELLSVQQIIEHVKKSSIDVNLKDKYVSMLEKLLSDLSKTTKEKEMKKLVLEVISNVKLELDKVNTNNEIYDVLRESNTSLIAIIGGLINQYDIEDFSKSLENIIVLISGSSDAISEVDADFGQLLKKSNLSNTIADDELYCALIKLTEDLNACADSNNVNENVKKVISNSKNALINALQKQKDNFDEATYVEEKLIEIFNLDDNSSGDDNNPNSGTQSGGNQSGQGKLPNQNGSGGLGTGDILFGSDDEFFDPNLGTVVFGDVITKYYADIISKIDDGEVSDELREYLEKYFEYLFGNLNNKDSEE